MKKILLSTSGSLGDILVLFPLLAGIRARYPEAKITVLNKHRSVSANEPIELVRQAGYADEIRCISKSALKLQMLLARVPRPGRVRWDTVFFLQRDGLSLPGKIRREAGFFRRISRTPVRGAVVLADMSDPHKQYPRVTEMLLARINHGSEEPITPGSHLFPLSERETAEADALLKELRLPADAVPFAVCIGGKKSVSRWPLENYIKLLAAVTAETKGVPVFLGGPADAEAIRFVMDRLPAGRSAYAAGTAADLKRSIALMSRLEFYLGNDTGSIHMAAAAGLRCVGIYSSQAPAGFWYPLGEGHRIFRCDPEPECVGCRKQDCPFGTPARCIGAIPEEKVRQAVLDLLREA